MTQRWYTSSWVSFRCIWSTIYFSSMTSHRFTFLFSGHFELITSHHFRTEMARKFCEQKDHISHIFALYTIHCSSTSLKIEIPGFTCIGIFFSWNSKSSVGTNWQWPIELKSSFLFPSGKGSCRISYLCFYRTWTTE